MKILSIFLTAFLCFPLVLPAQDSASAKLPKTPLSSEQAEIYRAFLSGYLKGSDHYLNLADTTDPFQPDDDDLTGCMKGFPKNKHALEVHKFTNEFSADNRIRLVDPSKYNVANVGDFMRKNGDLDDAVTAAVKAGLMSLSEVIIDHAHHRAALHFSFYCGKLCGSGGTVIFESRQGHWHRSKHSCARWES